MRGRIGSGRNLALVVAAGACAFSCTTVHKSKTAAAKQNPPPKVNSLSPMLPGGTEEDVWASIVREADATPPDNRWEGVSEQTCDEFGDHGPDDLAWDMVFGDHELQVAMAKENERLEAAAILAANHGVAQAPGDAPMSNCIPPITPDKFADGIGD